MTARVVVPVPVVVEAVVRVQVLAQEVVPVLVVMPDVVREVVMVRVVMEVVPVPVAAGDVAPMVLLVVEAVAAVPTTTRVMAPVATVVLVVDPPILWFAIKPVARGLGQATGPHNRMADVQASAVPRLATLVPAEQEASRGARAPAPTVTIVGVAAKHPGVPRRPELGPGQVHRMAVVQARHGPGQTALPLALATLQAKTQPQALPWMPPPHTNPRPRGQLLVHPSTSTRPGTRSPPPQARRCQLNPLAEWFLRRQPPHLPQLPARQRRKQGPRLAVRPHPQPRNARGAGWRSRCRRRRTGLSHPACAYRRRYRCEVRRLQHRHRSQGQHQPRWRRPLQRHRFLQLGSSQASAGASRFHQARAAAAP